MHNNNKGDQVIELLIALIAMGLLIGLIAFLWTSDKEYNTEVHSDDVTITEWVSPDGVHYWYQQAGYRAMLAPRYDSDGNLVIDKE